MELMRPSDETCFLTIDAPCKSNDANEIQSFNPFRQAWFLVRVFISSKWAGRQKRKLSCKTFLGSRMEDLLSVLLWVGLAAERVFSSTSSGTLHSSKTW